MIRFAIHRPVAISMLFIALMLVGVVSFKRIPVDLLPVDHLPAPDRRHLLRGHSRGGPGAARHRAARGSRHRALRRATRGVAHPRGHVDDHGRVRVGNADGLREPPPARSRRPCGLPRGFPRKRRAPRDPALGPDLAPHQHPHPRGRRTHRAVDRVRRGSVEARSAASRRDQQGGSGRRVHARDPGRARHAQDGDLRHHGRADPERVGAQQRVVPGG